MKKRILQCLSLILCAAMLAIPAAAAETADEEAPARLGPAAYWGTVTWMDEDTFLLDSGKEDGLGDAVGVHVQPFRANTLLQSPQIILDANGFICRSQIRKNHGIIPNQLISIFAL